MLGVTKIILVHNYPSGNLQSSAADVRFAEKVMSAGKVIDVPVVVHSNAKKLPL